jgi:NADPH2:quinone reductase
VPTVRPLLPFSRLNLILSFHSGKHLGAHIIGTTSTKEKAALALESGAEHCLLLDGSVNVVEEVFKITGGEGLDRGVHAVFDGVGKDTFEMDLEILRR